MRRLPVLKPLLYLILGAAGSGRRELLADLIANGLAEGDQPAVLLAAGERPDPFDARLPNLTPWAWTAGAIPHLRMVQMRTVPSLPAFLCRFTINV